MYLQNNPVHVPIENMWILSDTVLHFKTLALTDSPSVLN